MKPSADSENPSSLSLSKNRAMNENLKSCPSCDAVCPKDHRICLQCGYDWKTHKARKTAFQMKEDRKHRNPLLFLLLAIFGIGVWLFFQIRNPISPQAHSSAISVSIEEQKEMDYQDWLLIRDHDYPMLRVNDHGVVELLTGQVLRGKILSMNSENIVIDTELGEETIQFADLRPKSRILVDKHYRNTSSEKARIDIFGS